MTTFGVLLLAGIGFIILLFVFLNFFYLPSARKKDVEQSLHEIMKEKDIEYQLKRIKRGWCDFRLDCDDKTYYFKMFVVPGREEVMINSRYKWQVIGGAKGYLFLKGVKNFVDGPCKTDNKIVKVAVLYSYCKNVMYYLNECDTDFVTPKTEVYGVKVISFDELADKFEWL